MRPIKSETLLVFPLLPIFLAGAFPMLLMGLLGYAGLGLFGVLLMSVGFSVVLDAKSDFNEQLIVHGYVRAPERAVQASALDASVRFAKAVALSGVGLVAISAAGLAWGG